MKSMILSTVALAFKVFAVSMVILHLFQKASLAKVDKFMLLLAAVEKELCGAILVL